MAPPNVKVSVMSVGRSTCNVNQNPCKCLIHVHIHVHTYPHLYTLMKYDMCMYFVM